LIESIRLALDAGKTVLREGDGGHDPRPTATQRHSNFLQNP
jgi:hypothetical protein